MRRPNRRPRSITTLVVAVAALSALIAPAAHAADEPASGPVAQRVTGSERPTPREGRRISIDPAGGPVVEGSRTASLDLPALPSPVAPPLGRSLATAPEPVIATYVDGPQPGLFAGGGYVGDPADPRSTPSIAIGGDHIITVHGDEILVSERSSKEYTPAPNQLRASHFFDLPSGWTGASPRVLWDAIRERWIMTQVSWSCDGNGDGIADDPYGFVDLIISAGPHPMTTWTLYGYWWAGYLPTDPRPGLSTDKLAIGSDLYAMQPTSDCVADLQYVRTDLEIADWSDLLANDSQDIAWSGWTFLDDDPVDYTVFSRAMAAVQAPATSPVLHVLVTNLALSTAYYAKFHGSAVAGTIESGYSRDLGFAGIVAPLIDPPDPIQPGGTAVTTELDRRVNEAIWRDDVLTWVANSGCAKDGTTMRTCVRVTQVETTGSVEAAPILRQDFHLGGASHSLFAGGVAQSQDGDLHVLYVRSSTSQYATSYSNVQPSDAALDTLRPPVRQMSSVESPVDPPIWPASSSMAQDPLNVDAVIGAAQGFGSSIGASGVQPVGWGTTYNAISPLRVLDSRTKVGVSGGFAANAPRTFQVAGTGTIPDDAVAITGNLTVTGQSAGGYVSLTSAPTSTPSTSTLNMPVGDTRANNVTILLSNTGTLSAVYKAGAGKAAHLLLDVTGYFVRGGDGAGYQTIPPTRFLDTRSGAGLTGRFTSGTPRRLDVAGLHGVPAGAVSVTANLTVVGQSAGGYVSITPTSQTSPSSSTLNFPAGDVRANGLTAKLQGGDLWLVYKSSAGATTDLLLDITGYYVEDGSGLRFFPLVAGRIMDTRGSAYNLGGQFLRSGFPRILPTDEHLGVLKGARAVTGNLTVVGQTGAGYVSGTPVKDESPDTSTINFPRGDVRANGITVPLNGSGDQWFVYKSSSGTTTNLILGVTGYFQ
jgi:hypothetical protein